MKKYTIQLNWNTQYYNEILILHWSTDSLSFQLNSHQVVACMFLWNVTQIATQTNEGQKRKHTFTGLQFMTTMTSQSRREGHSFQQMVLRQLNNHTGKKKKKIDP